MKEKIVAIHQPNYIPWLGLFYKTYQSDIFVLLDDVQYSNVGTHNFHYIKTPQGSLRLKIPVEVKFGDKIMDVRTKDELNWKEKHLKSIESNYKKAPHFEQVFNDFKLLLADESKNLAELNGRIIKFIANKFGFKTEFLYSSSLDVASTRTERILDICNKLDCAVYYSGTGARIYQKEEDFLARGITLKYSEFAPFEYPQFWGDFIANVTILDYLMHCGYDWEKVIQNIEKK